MGGCSWCNAPRAEGPTCPRCGANYAKAELIRTQGRAAAPALARTPAPLQPQAAAQQDSQDPVDDPALELKFCVGAIPASLGVAAILHLLGFGTITRIFFAMPVHELGHALTAWFCGFAAIPTLWKTLIPDERGFVAPLLLFAALATLVYRAESKALKGLAIALIVLQGLCTFYLRDSTAEMLFVFGGDGIGMVLAAALMASFFFGRHTQLYKGSLRWGFVVIGAFAFVDLFAVWVAARTDFAALPFGENEGAGPSDAWKLVNEWRWSAETLVRRNLGLGCACLLALAAIYAWGVRRAAARVSVARQS